MENNWNEQKKKALTKKVFFLLVSFQFLRVAAKNTATDEWRPTDKKTTSFTDNPPHKPSGWLIGWLAGWLAGWLVG